MYKANNASLPYKLQSSNLANLANVYTTGELKKFNINFARTCKKANCLSILRVRLLNSLDKTISQFNCLRTFRKLLKHHLLNTY